MNKVILIGNLGSDPNHGTTDSGRDWANFSLATNERWKKADGSRGERADWHQVVAFGPLAKTLHRLTTGDLVAVEGKLRSRKKTRDGVTYTEVSIEAREVKFLRIENTNGGAAEEPSTEPYDGEDEEIPF